MSAWAEGARTGASIIGDGMENAYVRGREWANKLTEQKAEHAEKAAALKSSADRYKQDSIDKQVDEDRRIDKDAFDRSLETRKQAWAENPKNPNAVKANKPAAIGKNGKTLELSDFQRESLLQKAGANYLKASTDGDPAGVSLYGGLIEQYGGDVPPYEDKVPWYKAGHTPKFGDKPEGDAPARPPAAAPKPWKSYLSKPR